jgi:thiamine-monophosphate kinase
MLMDGVDFDVQTTSHELIGRKCLAVNLSDIAAMAGRPLAAFVSLALPRHGGRALAEELYHGMWPLASEFDVAIAGGDTNTWDGPLVVNVTVLGAPPPTGPVLRSGARSGDLLFVTGPLGGSIGGRHLSFTPRVREAEHLLSLVDLHALIDLSDGLASDVRHIADESKVGVVIDAESIPIHRDVDPQFAPAERLRHALSDGEDFELLFAVSADDGAKLLSQAGHGLALTCVGEVTDGHDCFLRSVDGTLQPLPRGGWEHRLD